MTHAIVFQYGGDCSSIQSIINDWEKRMTSFNDYYKEEDKLYGVDEKKRVGPARNSNTLFGVDGTFRQLAID